MLDKKEQLVKFSRWMRERLLHLAITARDLSLMSGVDESEVSRMTRGVRIPTLRTMRLLAPHLKCTTNDLLIAAGLERGDAVVAPDQEKPQRLYSRDEVEQIIKKAFKTAMELID